jgi:toxin ParE1/3/4
VKLRFTLPALTDLDEVLDYVAQRSPQGAARVQARIKAVVELVLRHPHIGTMTEDPTIRRMPTVPYPYLIFYEATADEVIVHAVRHGARDTEPAKRPLE